MVKGVRTGVGKYLAHGLKIRRASFTVRCISTNSRGMKQSAGGGGGAGGGGEGGGYFSLTSPSLCRPSFLSFYSGSRPWRWNNTGIAREKVLICRRGIIPLCMNIVKLFVPKRKAGIRGGEGSSSLLLYYLHYANYYCRTIFSVSNLFFINRGRYNAMIYIGENTKVLFENLYNVQIDIFVRGVWNDWRHIVVWIARNLILCGEERDRVAMS